MGARILAQCELEACVETQIATPTGGVARGEVFQSMDTIFFAFAKANPEDIIAGPRTISPDKVMGGFEDIFTGIKKCPKALIQGAKTGTGAVSFDIGQDVFFDIDTQEPKTSKTTDTVWIGQALEAKTTSQADFLIDYDGTNPSRSTS